MDALKSCALDMVRRKLSAGRTMDDIINSHEGTGSPYDKDGIARETAINGWLYSTRDADGKFVKVKRGYIGVGFTYADGHSEIAVFKVADLVDEILDPKPVQLTLFEVL